MALIALEGLPGAGKTTLLKHLGQLYGASTLLTIGEHIFDQTLFDLNTKFNDDHEAIYQLNWETKAAVCELFRDHHILLDRSYITCLAYNYAKAKASGDEKIYKRVDSWHRNALKAGKLRTVDVCIYLDVEPLEGNRRKGRTGTESFFWASNQTLAYTRDFYIQLLPHLPGAARRIVRIDANQPLGLVAKQTAGVISNAIR